MLEVVLIDCKLSGNLRARLTPQNILQLYIQFLLHAISKQKKDKILFVIETTRDYHHVVKRLDFVVNFGAMLFFTPFSQGIM